MNNTKVMAWLFTFLTFAGLIAFILVPKERKADFDIIGILFLLQNIAPITIAVVTFLCGSAALGWWLKYWKLKSGSQYQ